MSKFYSWTQFAHPHQEERDIARELAVQDRIKREAAKPKRQPYDPSKGSYKRAVDKWLTR